MATAAAKHPPVHRLAWLALGCSLVAVLLAFYGSLYAEKHIAGSPLREARGSAGLPAEQTHWWDRALDRGERTLFGEPFDRKVLALTERSEPARGALRFVAYVLPFLLGIAGGIVGGRAVSAIERAGGKYGGNLPAVFAILIGMFAAVIAGCMLVSQFAWAWVPGGYTA
jgi:hypothetical protein